MAILNRANTVGHLVGGARELDMLIESDGKASVCKKTRGSGGVSSARSGSPSVGNGVSAGEAAAQTKREIVKTFFSLQKVFFFGAKPVGGSVGGRAGDRDGLRGIGRIGLTHGTREGTVSGSRTRLEKEHQIKNKPQSNKKKKKKKREKLRQQITNHHVDQKRLSGAACARKRLLQNVVCRTDREKHNKQKHGLSEKNFF